MTKAEKLLFKLGYKLVTKNKDYVIFRKGRNAYIRITLIYPSVSSYLLEDNVQTSNILSIAEFNAIYEILKEYNLLNVNKENVKNDEVKIPTICSIELDEF